MVWAWVFGVQGSGLRRQGFYVTVHDIRPLIPVLNLNLTLNLNPRPRIGQGDPGSSGNYHSTSVEHPDYRSLRQKLGRLAARETGRDRFMEELEEASALFATGGNGSPHPFVVSLARFAASPLGNATVDHTVTHLLLAVVVGRLDVRFEHKAKIVL